MLYVLGVGMLLLAGVSFAGLTILQKQLSEHYSATALVAWYLALCLPPTLLHCVIDGSLFDGRMLSCFSSTQVRP